MRIQSVCILAGGMLLTGCGSELDLRNRTTIDTFVQRPNDEVDILFVVDDSASMAEEQEALATSFTAFLDQIREANAKFHLGVISTSQDSDDPLRGHLIGDPPTLTAADDFETLFRERVQLGIRGSDKEKGFEAAWLAVSDEAQAGPNAGFLREDAHLLTVFVTDEDDCSDGGLLDGLEATHCYTEPEQLVTPEEVVAHLWEVKGGDPTRVSIGAIITPEASDCGEGRFGSRYARAVRLAGGLIGDVCSTDWSSMLYDLGLTATGIYTQFELTHAADPATLSVWVDDVEIASDPEHGWTYDPSLWRLELHGDGVPARGATLSVECLILPGERSGG